MALYNFGKEKGMDSLMPLLCSNFVCKICGERKKCKNIKAELTEFFQSELYGVEVNQVDTHTLFSMLCNSYSCKKMSRA